MEEIDLEVPAELTNRLKRLAEDHYGGSSEAEVSKVVEAALALRFEWMRLGGEPAMRVEEPVTHWEFDSEQGEHDREDEIRSMLFKTGE